MIEEVLFMWRREIISESERQHKIPIKHIDIK